MTLYASITEPVGDTPLVALQRVGGVFELLQHHRAGLVAEDGAGTIDRAHHAAAGRCELDPRAEV